MSWKFLGAAAAALLILTAGVVYILQFDTEIVARVAVLNEVQKVADNGESSRKLVANLLREAANKGQEPSSRLVAKIVRDQQSIATLDELKGKVPGQTLHGYYGDMTADGHTKISKEKLQLLFSPAVNRVNGIISGPTEYEGHTVQRVWLVQGFTQDPQLVLNILTLSNPQDPKPPTGLGTYYLSRAEDDYTGTAIYLDCIHKFVQCPYALSIEDLTAEQARSRWPALFNRACVKLDLTPSLQAAPLSC